MIDNPAVTAIKADLSASRFQAGVVRGLWRIILLEFPILMIAIAATEPEGTANEYVFHFELSGYPGDAPEVFIWDINTNQMLPAAQRPKGPLRVTKAFGDWDKHTVYRPWERHSGAHNDWARKYPDLVWHSKRDITFILEDLHGLLNSNSLSRSTRPAA